LLPPLAGALPKGALKMARQVRLAATAISAKDRRWPSEAINCRACRNRHWSRY
jgi:hypothetical protein